MVEELEASMRTLELDEAGMIATIGAERVLELEKFWKNELDEIDMQEIRRGLDYNDRHLIFISNGWTACGTTALLRARARCGFRRGARSLRYKLQENYRSIGEEMAQEIIYGSRARSKIMGRNR